ncbi:MAG: hypothetical protein JSS61_02925 [Verrucomicrobia bacterium]|nr:hypothetical protein [Verrucomicrobiota bacterium]
MSGWTWVLPPLANLAVFGLGKAVIGSGEGDIKTAIAATLTGASSYTASRQLAESLSASDPDTFATGLTLLSTAYLMKDVKDPKTAVCITALVAFALWGCDAATAENEQGKESIVSYVAKGATIGAVSSLLPLVISGDLLKMEEILRGE